MSTPAGGPPATSRSSGRRTNNTTGFLARVEPKNPVPPPPSGPRIAPSDKYAAAALADELRIVESAPEGQRNHILNQAAFNLKSLVNAGKLDEDYLKDELTYAARRAGLDEGEIEPTIDSGFTGADTKVGARTVAERPPMQPPRIGVLSASESDSEVESAIWGEFPPMDAADWMFADEQIESILWGQDNDILWADGEALMIAGGMGLGKTTLAGNLIRAQLGLADEVLGLPVARQEKPILYLAMDRPRQIRRSMRRQFPEEEIEAIRGRLIVRQGPPVADLAVEPKLLARMAMDIGAGCVYVDSLKDAVIGLSADEVAAAYNRSRQYLLAQGINILELHHNRKFNAQTGGTGIGEIFGSTWLTSGTGSIIMLTGEPGDLVVRFHHRKTPADEVGPFHLHHDPDKGKLTIAGQIDLVVVARNAGPDGLTARAAAQAMYEKERVSDSDIKKAARQLDKLVKRGTLLRVDGERGGSGGSRPTVWFADPAADAPLQEPF